MIGVTSGRRKAFWAEILQRNGGGNASQVLRNGRKAQGAKMKGPREGGRGFKIRSWWLGRSVVIFIFRKDSSGCHVKGRLE